MAEPTTETGGRLSMYGQHWRPRPVDGDLSNFRNNGISRGFDGYSWVSHDGQIRELHEDGVILSYDIVKTIVGAEFFKEFYFSGPGNPPFVERDGFRLTSSDIIAIYNAWQLARWFPAPAHLVEIGPGYGALTAILRRIYPDTHITLVDLPERHAVLNYYLTETVGRNSIDITSDLPETADVVVALRCLMEMPVSEINRYFDWVQNKSGADYFYLINRYLKYTQLKAFPFDNYWIPLVNQMDIPARKMHELMLQRTPEDNLLLKMTLETLPPYIAGEKIYDVTAQYQIHKRK